MLENNVSKLKFCQKLIFLWPGGVIKRKEMNESMKTKTLRVVFTLAGSDSISVGTCMYE